MWEPLDNLLRFAKPWPTVWSTSSQIWFGNLNQINSTVLGGAYIWRALFHAIMRLVPWVLSNQVPRHSSCIEWYYWYSLSTRVEQWISFHAPSGQRGCSVFASGDFADYTRHPHTWRILFVFLSQKRCTVIDVERAIRFSKRPFEFDEPSTLIPSKVFRVFYNPLIARFPGTI